MRFIVIPLLALVASTLVASETVYTHAELDARLQSVKNVRAKSAPDNLDVLRKGVGAPGGDPATEFRLREAVMALELPLSAEAERLVQQFTDRKPSIRVWHEQEGHARVAEVALDVAAAARWKLRQDDVFNLATALKSGEDTFASSGEVAAAARHLALNLPADELQALAARIIPALRAGAPLEDALAIAATRSKDIRLGLSLIESGDPVSVRRHVAALHDALDAQRELLTAVMDKPALAPHAVALLGRHIHEDWAWQQLNIALGRDDTGATAAATLARHADEAQLATIAQRLSEDDPVARRAALVLYLNGSAYARQLLRNGAERGDVPAEVVQSWLD